MAFSQKLTSRESSLLFTIAVEAYARAKEDVPDIYQIKDLIVAPVFAVLAIEAYLNELAVVSFDELPEDCERTAKCQALLTAAEGENCGIFVKLQLASIAFTGARFDHGSVTALQDLRLLVNLRNALVHMKPQDDATIDDTGRLLITRPKIVAQLTQKGLHNDALEGDDPFTWLHMIASKKMAKWACQTVEAVQRHLLAGVFGNDQEAIDRHAFPGTARMAKPAPS